MEAQLACIVEGYGDVEALPILIRRIASGMDPNVNVRVPPPIRIPKSKLLKHDELERAIELAARKVEGSGAILVVLDGDDACPAQLGPDLLKRVQKCRSDIPSAVVVAKREFEAWFLAGAESLAGHRGLPAGLRAPSDPEAVRGAKEWLADRMPKGRPYTETLDQPALAGVVDIGLARRAESFDKLWREVVRLLSLV